MQKNLKTFFLFTLKKFTSSSLATIIETFLCLQSREMKMLSFSDQDEIVQDFKIIRMKQFLKNMLILDQGNKIPECDILRNPLHFLLNKHKVLLSHD